MKTKSNPNVAEWQLVAASEIQAIMKCWGCKTLSSLHKNGIVDFTTLKKLDPDSLNPTLTLDAVKNMLTKLFLVAGEMLEGDRKLRTQAQITASLMAVSASAMNLSESDLKKIEDRKRINNKHHN